MIPLQTICVFCGSGAGVRDSYRAASVALADALVERGQSLVYGGAHVGLMGVVADRVMSRGGKVFGVIPQALKDIEVAHTGLTELEIVPDMHARKASMARRADAFVALPGGLGTLEELFEVLTWAQLGFHRKPCGLLDVDGYYSNLLRFLDTASEAGFIRPAHRALLVDDTDAGRLLDRLARESVPVEAKLGSRPTAVSPVARD